MAEPDKKTRIPPNSKESEMMVLGCMLTNVNALNVGADTLHELDFYYNEHQIIYSTLKAAYCADKPADIHLIAEELKRMGKLDHIGGVSYLTTLAQYAGTSAYIEEYIDLVREKSILRQMVTAAQKIEKTALEEPPDVLAALDQAQAQFFSISQENQQNAGVSIKDLLTGLKAESKLPYLKELQARQQEFKEKEPGQTTVTGIPTHFLDLDKMLNGFNQSNFMILAARPSMGKTAIATNIAENICFKNKIPVGVFSLEMNATQILHRIISSQSEVESEKILNGSLSGSEYQRIVAAVNMMQKHTMIIDDQPGLKITDIRARARRMKEAYNVGFIVIDYLQLISGSANARSMENRQTEISEISRMLKNLARELNIPVLCLAQLSRKVEERQGHRPMMSDLRESGCLAGDTLIKDAETGLLHTIKELAERKEQTPISVFSMDEQLQIKPHKMTKVFYSGKKKIYELVTKSGRRIKASGNHPFYKLNGWTPLENLKAGDKIASPRELNTNPKKSALNHDELIFLGHLLGDGCILPKQPYHYTTADLENIDYVTEASRELFGIQTRIVKQKNSFHAYFPSPVHVTHRMHHPITNWFHQLKIERVRSYEKKVPCAVFSCTEKDRILFLKHLWATDGNISSKKLKGRKPACNIYYASSSSTLANQVQHLLLSTGIHSSLRVSASKKKYRPMYHVQIEGSTNQKAFLNKIGCVGERGRNIPIYLENLSTIKPNPNSDIIPKEVWSLYVKQAKDHLTLSWRDVCKGMKTAYCESSLFKRGISRKRLSTLSSFLQDQKLKDLAESDLFWDEISMITEVGTEDVYDATVPGVHNFVANDIIVHNSLEQDADIVMMLFRRDYYDKFDKPGLAEIIVAKNRHGPVGDVTVTFRREIGQFANYTPIHAQGDGGQSNKEAFSAFSPDDN